MSDILQGIFDQIIVSEIGEAILIPCVDERHRESLRSSLAYQRTKFLEKFGTKKFNIIIARREINNQLYVALIKAPALTHGLIQRRDGTLEPVDFKHPEPTTENPNPVSPTDLSEDKERLRNLMREDGLSEEEIEEYFNSEETSIIDTCSGEPEEENDNETRNDTH